MSAPRILVADDDSWILRMVTTVLEKRGYVVETAHDGEEAYEKALADPPDLVITDVMMPKMDGWTLIRVLRARPEFAFVPVIFLTALGSDDDRIRGFRLGADDYLPKPFRFEELDLRVTKTLKRSEQVEAMARERIGAVVRAVESEESQPTSSTLAGNLQQVGLSALLTLLEMERKSGVLIVTQDESQGAIPSGNDGADNAGGTSSGSAGGTAVTGRVYLSKGKCLSARLDGKDQPKNEDCIYFMLEWTAGFFEFQEVHVEATAEITTSTTHMLMEGARRIDERNAG